ncbi:alpha/beta fold hydrolase [Shewanella zhangzhouensis]|uniref:alpha/beta fold hydrolase n=1 Tax=Shewanella zhangzhouensis TaxID=2864213 RepID=UPI001C65DD43|nr:alpha/beta fold hydrolase [Shewanella zhangzhouensis]QYK06944.1 alpha/beta fold hydrolase [Shewanella zhangzhouensis]
MSAQLNYQTQGSGEDVILVHGLFGDLDNLKTLAQTLETDYRVTRIDVPNHGQSPHWNKMDYQSLAQSLVSLLDELGATKAHLIGHSMGGKIVLATALLYPERVASVVAADIAPVPYAPRHQRVFAALTSLPLDGSVDRKEALNHLLARSVDDATAQFLLKSFRRAESGFSWRMNLDGLIASYDGIIGWPFSNDSYNGPTLFIRGDESDYVTAEHKDAILTQFPKVQLKSIGGAGHWLHAQKPSIFNRLVKNFLDSQRPELHG